MSILDSIKKGIQTVYEDYNTPESFKIGSAFEEFTRETIFPKDFYDLIHKTADYSNNKKDFQAETLKPDFLFKDKKTNKEFYVECKFRSKKFEDNNALVEICKDYQIKRYLELNKKTPVFIALGFFQKEEGENCSVKELKNNYGDGNLKDAFWVCGILLIPVSTLSDNFFDLNNQLDYIIDSRFPLSSKKLWNYFANPENFLGYCIRCSKRIPENLERPLCYNCFKEWNKFKKDDFVEKVCHKCGEKNKTSVAKPMCYNCYKY